MVQTVRLSSDIAQLLYTVIDVPIVQVVQAFWFYVSGWTRLLRTILVLLCGSPVPQILEQIVEVFSSACVSWTG